MNDRELLEAAAMAAKLDDGWQHIFQDWDGPTGDNWDWNPLTDDGDALRLAVKLGISALIFPACVSAKWLQNNFPVTFYGQAPPWQDISAGQDPYAATRRAIVRAAASMATKETT
jgi:hypothetical protein